MARKIKKGTKGKASKFISRAKTIKKLDIALKDFRKLCILKGVHPREPSKRPANNTKTYYHAKDIKYLAEDRLLNHFRRLKIYRRKLFTAVVRKDKERVRRIKANKPLLDITHVVKERYPTFEDTLKDLDDPLSTLALVANFPGHRLFKVNPEQVRACRLLLDMFKLFVVKTQKLDKVFLSSKGVYFQAEIKGNKITWVEPYPFSQKLPYDVDYKVIMTFIEFYSVLSKFVIFKLYNENGITYPPQLIDNSETETVMISDNSGYLNFKAETVQKDTDEETDLLDSDELKKIQNKSKVKRDLFKNLVFFLSREVNKELFEFCIKSFGGKVLYDIDNFESENYNDNSITHVITDRNANQIPKLLNREYVQPQWICDSINNSILLPISDYLPGNSLPPHLSPFVNDVKEGYIPDRMKDIMKMKGEYEEVGEDEFEDSEEEHQENETEGVYQVEKEDFNIEKEEVKAKIQKKKQQSERQNLAEMKLSKKKKRLLDKIKKFDENKKEKIKELIKRKKALKAKGLN